MDNITQRKEKVNFAIEIAIKLGFLAMVIYFSYLIAKPFLPIVVWGIIIAIALSPVINSLEKRFGHRKKIIIGLTAVVILGLLIPTYMLSEKTIQSSQTLAHALKDGNVTIPPPTEKVKEWPLIGEKAYIFWDSASKDLKDTLEPFNDKIKKLAGSVVSALGSGLSTILMFVGSMIIAAAFLIGRDGAVTFSNHLYSRLFGEKRGSEWAKLSTLTVRSVVTGVLGCGCDTSSICFNRFSTYGYSTCYSLGIWYYVPDDCSGTRPGNHWSSYCVCIFSRKWNT